MLKLLPRLTRFDLDFDLPEQILPEAAPATYLTTPPDLGDVAKGRLVTINNCYEIFNGILNPKQLDGLRLLVTQFPQQQFNATEDRRTDHRIETPTLQGTNVLERGSQVQASPSSERPSSAIEALRASWSADCTGDPRGEWVRPRSIEKDVRTCEKF